MQLEIDDVLKVWVKAQMLVLDNTSLMIKYRRSSGNAIIDELCVARMKVHNIAEEMLMSLQNQEDLPPLLLNFFEANNDKGCDGCWLSSSISNKHEDCNIKINRWFDTRKKLLFDCQLLNETT